MSETWLDAKHKLDAFQRKMEYNNWLGVVGAIGLFVLAGVCEIGGGWLVWKWKREGWHWIFFVLGAIVLILYGIVPTLQHQPFARTYAAYGGFFVALSFLWGWMLDSQRPDRWDVAGSAVCLVGVCIIMFVPRNSKGSGVPMHNRGRSSASRSVQRVRMMTPRGQMPPDDNWKIL